MDARAKGEPCVHRKNVLGFRVACEQLWGKVAFEETIARLPPDARAATAGLIPLDEWVAESFLIAWAEAVWGGPAKMNEAAMRRYVSAAIMQGFGQVRRFFLQMVTPEAAARRVPELWRQEHTTGTLEAEIVRDGVGRVVLSDHPYVETPLMRMAIAEAIRCSLSLTRASTVNERHAHRGRQLRIELTWAARE